MLLTVGRSFDAATLGRVPDNVHVEAWVDQAAVLPLTRLVVCHGGSGTVLGALAAGVPLVVVPVFGDQVENGRRVAAANAGLMAAEAAVSRTVPAPVALITEHVARVLADPSYRDAAGRIAHQIASTSTADDALEEALTLALRVRGE